MCCLKMKCLLLLVFCVYFSDGSSASESTLEYITFLRSTYGRNLSQFAAERGIVGFEGNFTHFCSQFKKEYFNSEEIEYRKGHYLYSLSLVVNASRDFEAKRTPFRLAINRFADMGMNENPLIGQKWINPQYIDKHRSPPLMAESGNPLEVNSGRRSVPENFDWRNRGIVSAVQNQGNCGSCWIFAPLSVVESANALADNPLVSLSVQELMDCIKPPAYLSSGCDGGTADDAYEFVQKFGVVSSRAYPRPYKAQVSTCESSSVSSSWRANILSFTFLPINASDEQIMRAIHEKGPVAAIINAGDRQFVLYSGGVLNSAGSRDLFSDYNHYVVIVGWGTEAGYPYWIVRNSWGSEWGEDGYVKLARGINNRGINTIVSYAEARHSNQTHDHEDDHTDVHGSASLPRLHFTFLLFPCICLFTTFALS